jgi:hypothetical protein
MDSRTLVWTTHDLQALPRGQDTTHGKEKGHPLHKAVRPC